MKRIISIGIIGIMVCVGFLALLPANVSAYSEIEGVTYPTEVHQESSKILEVDVANYGYYDESYTITVYLKYPGGGIVTNEEGYRIVLGEDDVTVPAKTILRDCWVFISIPSTVPLGQYHFYVVLYDAGTAIMEDDHTTGAFTLLEKKEYQPYREPVPSFEATYLLAIIGIYAILLKGRKKKEW
ncbi:MAG: hypothetical protein KKA79_01610 [Nanoarchaeota archaeon]|nr:hypothetical protein [Nanoarchaeota archaeon]